MTKEKFKEIMESGEKVYLYFFSPFCGSCELTKPLLKKSKHPIFEINSIENKELEKAFDLEYYPTIIEVRNNNFRKFEGRTAIENLLS
jgi:thiol-disulfide isomerase/thioredoxin